MIKNKMEINNYRDTIRACRYCPMCRHVCTSGNLSFHESDYPRGRGLLLDKVNKGTLQYSPDIVEALYNCFLCGCCWANCEGNFPMHRLVEAARKDIVDAHCQPELAENIRDALVDDRNPYADFSNPEAVRNSSRHAVFKPQDNDRIDKNAEILYFMGDNIKFNFHEIAQKTIGVLDWLGADYTLLSEEPTDGKILKLLGFTGDAEKKAKGLAKKIKSLKVRSVVVSDPLSYDAFKNDFTQYGVELEPGIEHTSQLFAEFMEGYRGDPVRSSINRCEFRDLKVKRTDKKATIADSEFLGRFNSVYEEPRNLVQAIAGGLVEMRSNRKKALATGEAAFIFNGDHFRMGKKLGENICREARFAGAELIVTLSATAKKNLETGCENNGLEVMEISEFLWSSIKNNKKEVK